MLVFPNAKINIGLNITGKRADGFHDLETIFFPVNIRDALEVIPNDGASEDIIFSSSGNEVGGDTESNLCVKAYRLIKKDFPQLPPVKMHLHKAIPQGAGLGGGSADASFTLLLLNDQFQLSITEDRLAAYALQLGSDCPFFILNKPAFGKGRGENLSPVNIDLAAYKIMIVHPGIHISTAQAFAGLEPNSFSPAGELANVIGKPLSEWKTALTNDFEPAIFKLHPEIAAIKDKMYKSGAGYSAMSGSGSSVYGIFPGDATPNLKFPSHWFCQTV